MPITPWSRSHASSEPAARQFPSVFNDFLALSGLAARFPRSRLFGRFDRTWAPVTQAADVDWVPGAFAIIRREVLDQVGRFDERFFLYYEEVDLCRRIKSAGWRIRYWPDIVVHHWGGESSKTLTGQAISRSSRASSRSARAASSAGAAARPHAPSPPRGPGHAAYRWAGSVRGMSPTSWCTWDTRANGWSVS